MSETLPEKPKCRVVIVGAGPAGLLAAINFCGARVPVQYEVDLWWKERKGYGFARCGGARTAALGSCG